MMTKKLNIITDAFHQYWEALQKLGHVKIGFAGIAEESGDMIFTERTPLEGGTKFKDQPVKNI